MAESTAANPGFVYDGYSRFWRVADQLMRDREPDDSFWHDLLSAPGYKELIAHEFSEDFFPEQFRLAFKPSLGPSLAHVLRGGHHAGLLRHYLQTAETRDHIAKGMEAIAAAPVATVARQWALAWLPHGLRLGFPTVAFVIFAPDARGYEIVVVDAAFACQLATPQAMLAHEYHHVFRRQVMASRPEPRLGDKDVLWVLDQLEAEGIADQIDKRGWPGEAPAGTGRIADYARAYRRHFETAPGTIRQLDALLANWHDTPGDRQRIAGQLRSVLPLAGHPTGSFMARLIERRLGRDACVATVGNPFAFVRLYCEAAKATGAAPMFGDAALAAVATLERSYLTA